MPRVEIQMNLIGYNERGFIGFMTGGKHLSYLDSPDNSEEKLKELGLPYISPEDVRATNSYVDSHPEKLKGEKVDERSQGIKSKQGKVS